MSKTEADRGELVDGPMEPSPHSASDTNVSAQGDVALAASWSQRGIYVRMSKQRKAALLRFAERSGNTESPHQALSACIEYADAYARGQCDSGHDKVTTGGEFDGGTAIDERLASLENSLARIERAVATGGDAFGRTSAISARFANSRDLDQFSPETMAVWLDALARSQPEESELTLLTARWAWTSAAHRNSTKLSVAFEMSSADTATVRNDPAGRIQVLNLPIDSALLSKTISAPKLDFIVACRRTSTDGQWLASFLPKRLNGELDEAIVSVLISDRHST